MPSSELRGEEIWNLHSSISLPPMNMYEHRVRVMTDENIYKLRWWCILWRPQPDWVSGWRKIMCIFTTFWKHMELLFFSSLSNINCTQLKLFYFIFCSQAIEQICFNISARFQTNKYIHSSENGFIYKNTNMKLQSDKKKLNVFG